MTHSTTHIRHAILSAMAVVLLGATSLASAAVTVPKIFGDHMLLQRDKPVRIWGWAKAGEKVTVAFAGQSKTATTDAKGNWLVTLDPMKASFDGRPLIVQSSIDNSKSTFADVLVGELWMCGGQSNMEFTLRSSRDGDIEIPCATDPSIRFIRLPKLARLTPQKDFPVKSPEDREGNWRIATSDQVENCTGVGYFFAKRLRRRLNVPVGLIDTSWGGTMAQHWVTKDVLRKIPEMKPYFEKFDGALKAWTDGGGEEGANRRYDADVKQWEKDLAKAKAANEKRLPRKPDSRNYTNPADKGQPGGMYNGVIAPIEGLTIRGVLFYQGENNSFGESWKPFHTTFPAVITAWRKAFNNADMPFGIVQIAGWSSRRSMTYDMNHHTNVVREIQLDTWKRTKNTGLIVTYDTNVSQGIHPARKMPVGDRSARWALSEVYGIKRWGANTPLEWRGPLYKSMIVKDGKIVISFEKEGSHGLVLDQDDDDGFYIAGKDREFHFAKARVNGADSTLTVWSDDVKAPVAVRFSWSNLPTGTLMNRRELPAYPFRTDNWPITPHQSTGEYIRD